MTESTETTVDAPAEAAPASQSQNALALVRQQVVAIDRVQAGIDELRRRFSGVVFDVTTTKGMDEAKKARMEIREPRFAVGRAVQAAKRPLNDLKKAIEERAADITAQLQAIEDPIHAQITAEEDRKAAERAAREQAERDRAQALEARVDGIRAVMLDLAYATSSEIVAAMDNLQALEIGEDWGEFQPRGLRVRDEVLASLRALLLKAQAREEEAARLEAARAEIEAAQAELRRQQEEQARAEAEARAQLEAEQAAARAERERLEAEAQAAQAAADAAARAERERLDAIAAEERRKADEAAAEARAAEQARLDAEAAELRRQREEQERVEREAREEAERREREAKAAEEAKAQAERDEAMRIWVERQAADQRKRDAAADMLEALQRVISWDDAAKQLPADVLLVVENAIHEATGGKA